MANKNRLWQLTGKDAGFSFGHSYSIASLRAWKSWKVQVFFVCFLLCLRSLKKSDVLENF